MLRARGMSRLAATKDSGDHMHRRGFHPVAAATLAAAALTGCATDIDAPPADRAAPVAQADDVTRVVYADDGAPIQVRGRLGEAAAPIRDVADVTGALATALPPIAATFQVRAADLVPTRVQRDRLGMTHVRYTQRKNDLRVVGGDLVVHLDADGVIRSANGTARDGGALPATPTIRESAAAELARAATVDATTDATGAELVYVITTRDQTMHLAWEVELVGRDVLLVDLVYVDALTGAIVDRHPQVFTARNRQILDGQGRTFPIFFPAPPQIGSEGHPPTDPTALAAYDNTGATYDCYAALFGRDSYDDSGGTLKSTVHVKFQTPSGTTTGNNAAWALGQMVYGDGDGTFMGPTTFGFDVTAHELTHGVTQNTAQLAYQNESGALNEAMSDIMASVCEAWRDGAVTADTWLIGEDIFTPATAGDALRYMNDPTADAYLYPAELGGSRDFYADRYTGSQDNGGVHLNSGIANLAFQLLVAGGSHPQGKTTFDVPAIGMEQAGAIFERALTEGYLTSSTDFAGARTATEQVAAELYPGSAQTAVGLAWAAVGIGSPPPSDATPPEVQIVSPADGATVQPGFAVDVNATDDVGVLRVELSVDGALVGTDTAAPYAFTTDAGLAAGSHTVEATAFDAFNEASASITVTVADDDDGGGDDDGGDDDGGGVGGDDDDDMPGGCGCRTSTDSRGAAGQLLVLFAAVWLARRRRR